MNKKLIRLTESDLHRIVKESVNKVLTELDWKTYANYANRRRAQGEWSKADAGDDAAIDAFNKKYHASDYENRNGLERSANFSMSNGADGAKKYDLGYRSSVKNNGDYQQYINRHRESGLYEPFYKDQTYNQGEWYGQHGMNDDDVKNTNNMGWSQDVKSKMNQGIRDVDRFQKGQSKYVKGQGWQ